MVCVVWSALCDKRCARVGELCVVCGERYWRVVNAVGVW